MAILIGVILALSVGLFASGVGLDRDRAFYPTVTIVIAGYYVLFAAMGGSRETLIIESLVAIAFTAAAATGFKVSLWLAVAALAAHGGLDLVHAELIANPGVPIWWPPFCMAYDLTAAAYLAWILRKPRPGLRP